LILAHDSFEKSSNKMMHFSGRHFVKKDTSLKIRRNRYRYRLIPETAGSRKTVKTVTDCSG
jgi:hypothetical protein